LTGVFLDGVLFFAMPRIYHGRDRRARALP
jgi:hypothetical protein